MEIVNFNNGKYNFRDDLKPLFEAMEKGKMIKSVTCMKGSMNKSDTSKDFKIENFMALTYYVAKGYSAESGDLDYVETDPDVSERNYFYMSWVRNFELY